MEKQEGLRMIPASGMPYRTLGRTGESVSIVGLGGGHIGVQRDEDLSIRIIRTAIDGGINFMDNSWDYSEGVSEIRMGKALRDGYRDRVFLMTKIDGQTRKAAAEQLDESLRRLQTDTIDLLQFHEVIRMSDPDRIFGPGGGMEAVLAARDAGKVRYIGFTGHKSPDIHRKMLQTALDSGFVFDAVQMPLNVMDAHYDSFEKGVLPILLENEECFHYAMSLPASVVITGCESLALVEQALEAARSFHPLSEGQIADLLSRTAKEAEGGIHEPYKTGEAFDATSRNPHWLG
jgi:aryl-alcohol dehydrogenase-like predicted oxidoreductase